ncbi:MAG: isoleucine--tRNA ligase [Candidatus Aenigmarchaeota archaeon]|nr:isoleucine--tRNA ligase [Candidatus Aenigmarchaeota archaeon]
MESEDKSYDPKIVEKRVSLAWSEKKVPESIVSSKREKKFYLLDGPPYVNAPAHVGHVKTTTFKDIWGKFKFMQGYGVWFQPGFDCGGLPIENKVEQKLGLRCKADIEKAGIGKFIKECRVFARGHETEWLDLYRKIGAWRGYVEPYLTSENYYRESGWWTIKKIFEKGLLARGEKPTFWCPHCETVLSGYDVTDSYKEIESPSIYIKFKAKGKENEFFLAWTTTPWTLPANVSLCVHPDETYVRAEVGGEIFIMAKDRLDLLENLGWGYRILEEFPGKKLEGTPYESLIDIPIQAEIDHRVILSIPLMKKKVSGKVAAKKETAADEETQFGHLVDISTGTGIVHIAPGHGEEDYRIGEHYGLSSISPVDEAGKLSEGTGKFEGITTDEANVSVLDYLKEKNALFHSERIVHSYPLCWRCKTPLIYRKTKQWFLKLDTIRDKMLHENKSVRWLPSFAGEQYHNVVASSPDWAITRQRYWGIPFPLWVCRDCGRMKMIGSVEELKENAVCKVPDDLQLSVDYVDGIKFKCECGGVMEREREVMDVWFDSGIAPWASIGYPYQNKDLFEKMWKVDMITEGIDQIRGWFNSLMVYSVATFGEGSYKAVGLSGWNLDEKGEKMSKSLGNVVWGKDAYNDLGADILRLYVCYTNAPWEAQRFSLEEAGQLKNTLNTLWNLSAYLETYGRKIEGGNGVALENIADLWLVSRINTLVEEVTDDLENFRFHYASRKLMKFLINDFSRLYVKLVRSRIAKEEEVSCAFQYALMRLVKLLAPFAPFLSDEIWMRSFEGSVHMSEWPECDKKRVDKKLEESFELAKEITEAINAERQKNGVGLRHPVLKATVYGGKNVKEAVNQTKEIVLTLSNLKNVEFTESDNVEIKPNFATLGKKFGKDTQAVAKLILALTSSQVKDEMDLGGFKVEKSDLIIRQKPVEGTTFSEGYVALDLTETQELKEERLLRELVREIQKARKDAGLKVSDSIALGLEDKPFLKRFEEEIKEEVGASSVKYSVTDGKGFGEYKDLKVGFGFKKA